MRKRHLHYGGELVGPGLYLRLRTGQLVDVDEEEPLLPGDREQRYLKAPLPLVLLVGPAMGLAYVVFLPLAGFAVVLSYMGYLLVWRPARAIGQSVQGLLAAPAWRFGISYLAGPERRRKAKGAKAGRKGPGTGPGSLESSVDELLKEIEERKEQEEGMER